MAVINGTNGVVAWAIIKQTDNTIRSSYNVSSLTDDGSGRQELNLSTAAADNNYGILGDANSASAGENYQNRGQMMTCYQANLTSTSSSVPFAIEYAANAGAGDVSHITIVVIGRAG